MKKARLGLMLGGALVLGYTASAQAALEMYSDFESPATIVSVTGGSPAAGRLSGAKPPAYIDGGLRSQKALHFAGGGLVYFPDIDSPQLGDEITLNLFVNFKANVNNQQTLVGRPGGWFWSVNLARRVCIFAPSRTKNPASFPLPVNFAGKWQMLTLVKKGNAVELFINGKSQGTRALTDQLETFGALYVGGASSTAGNPLAANIDGADILVRPEDVVIGGEGAPATIESVLFEGERYAVKLTLGNGQALRAYSRVAVVPDEAVHVVIRAGWRL